METMTMTIKEELKEFCVGTNLYKEYIKAVQKEWTDYVLNDCVVNGYNAIKTPNGGYWIIPHRHKSETERGFRSRVMSWALKYIDQHFTDRWNNEEGKICNLIFPEDIPNFGLEGITVL